MKNPMGFTHRDRNQEGTRGFSPNSINHLAWIATKCDRILFRCVCVCVRKRERKEVRFKLDCETNVPMFKWNKMISHTHRSCREKEMEINSSVQHIQGSDSVSEVQPSALPVAHNLWWKYRLRTWDVFYIYTSKQLNHTKGLQII